MESPPQGYHSGHLFRSGYHLQYRRDPLGVSGARIREWFHQGCAYSGSSLTAKSAGPQPGRV